MQESPNRAEEPISNNTATFMKMDFQKNGESCRKRRKISHEKMSSKLKESEREKESLRRKMKRFYKRIQRRKKILTKLTPNKN